MKNTAIRSVLAAGLALVVSAAVAGDFSAAEMKKMGTFLSNFTELGLYDIDVDGLKPGQMVRFGIWHNEVNNFKTRIRTCPAKGCQWGGAVISGRFVAETLERYFGPEFRWTPTCKGAEPACHYDGSDYHFEPAAGEATYYARVRAAAKQPDGTVKARGVIYNAEDPKAVSGSFEAVLRPSTWKGKPSWTIVRLKAQD